MNHITATIARPAAIIFLSAALVLWIGGNLAATWTGGQPFDPYPFVGLEAFATIGALCATVLILVSQRHADDLASRREQLILQLAMASEQKSAKVIELLEELRRDDPLLKDREDRLAQDMSKPADTGQVIEAIKDAIEPAMEAPG